MPNPTLALDFYDIHGIPEVSDIQGIELLHDLAGISGATPPDDASLMIFDLKLSVLTDDEQPTISETFIVDRIRQDQPRHYIVQGRVRGKTGWYFQARFGLSAVESDSYGSLEISDEEFSLKDSTNDGYV